MGEFEVSLEDAFASGTSALPVSNAPSPILYLCILTASQAKWFPLISKKKKGKVSGEIKLDLAVVDNKGMPGTAEQITSFFKITAQDDASAPSNEYETAAG